MVRLVVPPVETQLYEALETPLQKGVLNDDDTWVQSVLPLLLDRIDQVKAAVHQAQTTNASGPTAKDVDTISGWCDKIRKHLEGQFKDGAPFTIYRLAELVLEPEKSGYSLATVQLAERYLAAFSRTIMVLSKETHHLENENGVHQKEPDGKIEEDTVPNKATPSQYEEYDLPRDVTYISLPWAHQKEKEDTLPSKRQKIDNQLLSPLRESLKPQSRSPERSDSSSPTQPASTSLDLDL